MDVRIGGAVRCVVRPADARAKECATMAWEITRHAIERVSSIPRLGRSRLHRADPPITSAEPRPILKSSWPCGRSLRRVRTRGSIRRNSTVSCSTGRNSPQALRYYAERRDYQTCHSQIISKS